MMSFSIRPLLFACAVLTGVPMSAFPQDEAAPALDSYQLSVRDLVQFAVLGEPETEVQQRIDGQGRIRVPYLGNVEVTDLTIREAEEKIEKAYLEEKIYTKLQVTLRVAEYSIKEVSVLGQVKNPGKVQFPIELNRLDIRDVISQVGGFTNIARAREVRITRKQDGAEEVFTVNVEGMLSGRGGSEESFYVKPGDVLFVPERFF